jgi:hypothetical protein
MAALYHYPSDLLASACNWNTRTVVNTVLDRDKLLPAATRIQPLSSENVGKMWAFLIILQSNPL